jgi:hypothetical protein
MSYWRRRLTARLPDPPVPIVATRLHRVFWVPRRYVAMASIAFVERRLNIRRDYATPTGYSVKGAWSAIQSLREMGLISLTTKRGCRGWTRVRVNGDAAVGNVSATEQIATSPTGDTFLLRFTSVAYLF